MPMTSPVEKTVQIMIAEANKLGKRAIGEDRPDLIDQAEELITLAYRVAKVFKISLSTDMDTYISDLKKRFLLSTTLPVVAGIYSEDAIAAPVDMEPLRKGSRARLGVGLAEHGQVKEAIDAPVYHPDAPCYGIVVPAYMASLERDLWIIVREKGDVSFIAQLEHEWIRNLDHEMVLVRHVLGVGNEADRMAAEVYPQVNEWVQAASNAFHERFNSLSSAEAAQGISGFYHLGEAGFCLHPWDEVEPVHYQPS
jgi:hypothetical protein